MKQLWSLRDITNCFVRSMLEGVNAFLTKTLYQRTTSQKLIIIGRNFSWSANVNEIPELWEYDWLFRRAVMPRIV